MRDSNVIGNDRGNYAQQHDSQDRDASKPTVTSSHFQPPCKNALLAFGEASQSRLFECREQL
jgi:hypothetical protein